MVLEQKHIINKLVVEVNTNNNTAAFKIKDQLDVFLKEEVLPYVENYINSISAQFGNNVIQIPKLEIEISSTPTRDFEDLKSQMKTAVVKALSNLFFDPAEQNKQKVRIITLEEYSFESFINFIKTGQVSWFNTSNKNHFDIRHLKKIVSSNQFGSTFIKALASQKAQVRLVNQFSDKQIIYLLENVFKPSENILSEKNLNLIYRLLSSEFMKNLKPISYEERQVLWQLIINYLLYGQGKPANSIPDYISQNTEELRVSSQDKGFKRSLQQILKELDISINQFKEAKDKKSRKREPHTNDDRNKNQKIDDGLFLNSDELKKGIIVENAGLILTHPYLNQFFKACSLLDDEGQLCDKVLAVHVLHYLATKKENQYENRMVFEKLLCGISLQESINRHVIISKELKNNCEELLSSVISNWGALKNASPDLLRREFLTRKGKIILKNETLKLIVEQKTQDILLNKLPWTISYCKLSWLKQLITTDW